MNLGTCRPGFRAAIPLLFRNAGLVSRTARLSLVSSSVSVAQPRELLHGSWYFKDLPHPKRFCPPPPRVTDHWMAWSSSSEIRFGHHVTSQPDGVLASGAAVEKRKPFCFCVFVLHLPPWFFTLRAELPGGVGAAQLAGSVGEGCWVPACCRSCSPGARGPRCCRSWAPTPCTRRDCTQEGSLFPRRWTGKRPPHPLGGSLEHPLGPPWKVGLPGVLRLLTVTRWGTRLPPLPLPTQPFPRPRRRKQEKLRIRTAPSPPVKI